MRSLIPFTFKKRMQITCINGFLTVIITNRNKFIRCDVHILTNCDKKKPSVGVNVTTYAGHRSRRLFPFCHLRGILNILYKICSIYFAKYYYVMTFTTKKSIICDISKLCGIFFLHQSKNHTYCSPEYISPFGHSLSKPLIVDDFFPYKEEQG